MGSMSDAAWLERIRAERQAPGTELCPIADDGHATYRPFEMLCGRQAELELVDVLRDELGGRPYVPDQDNPDDWRRRAGERLGGGDVNRRLADANIELKLWALDPKRSGRNELPERVRDLRGRLSRPATEPGYEVTPNYVLFSEQIYHGGPGDGPVPCPKPTLLTGISTTSNSVDLAVLDVGLPAEWPRWHSELVNVLRPDSDDDDQLDETGRGNLDTCAGHGLFICGLVHRVAPDLVVDPGRVLHSTGISDDSITSVELKETTAPVISLSFSTNNTMDNEQLPGLASAIRQLVNDGRAIVAAAGNGYLEYPEKRLAWPAAMPEVISVGALDTTPPGCLGRLLYGFRPRRAPFSYREKVDVWAPGVRLRSTYVNAQEFAGGATWSGTSFAAPLVAAEIAMWARKHPALAARDVALTLLGCPIPGAPAELRPLSDSPWTGTDGRKAKLYQPPIDLVR